MHILFVCRFLPHSQARDSGRLDTFHYIASLSQQHTVSVISFVPIEDESGIAELQSLCEHVIRVPFAHTSLLSRLKRAWWRLLLPKVYGRNHSSAYRHALRTLLKKNKFDIAVVDGMMAEYGRFLDPIPHILDEVDLFFMVAHHLYQNETNPLQRPWLWFDWLRTMAWEAHYITSYQGIFVRSIKDKTIVSELAPQQQINLLPPWFEGLDELQTIPIQRPSTNNLLFVGAMNIPANIEAITFFAKQVLPLVHNDIPDVHLYVVGSNPTPAIWELSNHPGITVTGMVPSLAPYYANATLIIVPLFTGGGIIVKTLNGLASGRPTITTFLGNSGTGAEHKRDLWIVPPDPQAMSIAIRQLLTDTEQWYNLAQNGRTFIQENYAWEQTIQKMTGFLYETASKTAINSDISPK